MLGVVAIYKVHSGPGAPQQESWLAKCSHSVGTAPCVQGLGSERSSGLGGGSEARERQGMRAAANSLGFRASGDEGPGRD